MVAARISNMKGGSVSKKSGPIGPVSKVHAAKLLNVGRTTVTRARQVLAKGTKSLVSAGGLLVRPAPFALHDLRGAAWVGDRFVLRRLVGVGELGGDGDGDLAVGRKGPIGAVSRAQQGDLGDGLARGAARRWASSRSPSPLQSLERGRRSAIVVESLADSAGSGGAIFSRFLGVDFWPRGRGEHRQRIVVKEAVPVADLDLGQQCGRFRKALGIAANEGADDAGGDHVTLCRRRLRLARGS